MILGVKPDRTVRLIYSQMTLVLVNLKQKPPQVDCEGWNDSVEASDVLCAHFSLLRQSIIALLSQFVAKIGDS